MSNIADKIKPEQSIDIQSIPILPLKGTVVFPYIVVPLMIQEPQHAKMVDEALMRGSRIGLFLQKDAKQQNPGPDDLYHIGTSATILKMLRFPDSTVRFLVQGLSRIKIKKFTSKSPYLTAEVIETEETISSDLKLEALSRNLSERIRKLVDLAPYLSEEFYVTATNQDTPSKLTDFISSNLNLSNEQKQQLL